jgi:hypothetical protein
MNDHIIPPINALINPAMIIPIIVSYDNLNASTDSFERKPTGDKNENTAIIEANNLNILEPFTVFILLENTFHEKNNDPMPKAMIGDDETREAIITLRSILSPSQFQFIFFA